MSKAVSIAKEQVSAVIEAAMKKAMTAGMLPEAELPAFTVERPADRSHGDFATNAAMASARAFRMAPPKIAAAIMENLDLNGTYFVKAETAGPGFMNFFLGSAFYSDVLTEVLTKDSAYGRSDYGNHRKVMVEFVSANPTGPMHMGNARGGALGDCLASVLDAAGYDVWREFYVNDAGNQLDKFGLSLSIRYQQLFAENPPELPEDSYHGEDILDLAKEYAKEHGDELMHVTEEERRKALVGFGLPKNIAKMKDGAILINNAGCGYLGRMGETETAVQTRMVDLNVRAMTAMTNLVIPYMPAGGRILNTSSIASFCPTPRMTVYGASKAYVSSFTVGLSEELKRRDITVTAVCPGPMKTEFLDVGSITGRSPAFEYLPYCDQVRVAAGALRAAKAGRTMYTPRLFYKFYRLLAKVAPVKLMVKFTKT